MTTPGDKANTPRDGQGPVRSKELLTVLARLDPLGAEDQMPDLDETLLPAKEIDLRSGGR